MGAKAAAVDCAISCRGNYGSFLRRYRLRYLQPARGAGCAKRNGRGDGTEKSGAGSGGPRTACDSRRSRTEKERRGAEDFAQEQRNQALLQESQAVSILSRQATARGDAMTGMLSVIEVLPNPVIGRDRPASNAASSALLDSWLHNRELADLLGHTGPVKARRSAPTANASSPRLTTARRGSGICSGPRPVATALEGHTDSVLSAAFSPDGKRVVTAS